MTRVGHALLTLVGGACLAVGCSGSSPRDQNFNTDLAGGFEPPARAPDGAADGQADGNDQTVLVTPTAGTAGTAGASGGTSGTAGAAGTTLDASASDGGAG